MSYIGQTPGSRSITGGDLDTSGRCSAKVVDVSYTGHPMSSSPISSAALRLLTLALRARPATVDELATLSRHSVPELRARLAELDEHELIALTGDQIGYRSPAQTVSALSTRMLDAASRDLAARLAETTALLAAVPELVASAAIGTAEHGDFGGEIFHGPSAAHELWRSLVTQQHSRESACMFPDAEALLVPDSELSDTWRSALGDDDIRVRAIIGVADLARSASQAMIEAATASGVEFRAIRRPPSWFWLTDDAVGLPLNWGDPWPTSAVLLRSEPVVSLMHGLFERWWADAVAPRVAAHPWDAILALMADGATLETASHATGVSSRTGRRRIEAAMDHYDVTGAVALGAAWQREREGAGR